MTNSEYNPDDALMREGLAISERAQVLTMLAGFSLVVSTVIALSNMAAEKAESGSPEFSSLWLVLVVTAPFVLLSIYLGWRPLRAFHREHPEAYRAGQNKLEQLSRLPIWARTIFTRDQYGNKIQRKHSKE